MEKSTPALVHQTPEGIDGEKYEPLEILIEPFIHLSLNELPDAVRKRVDKAYFLRLFWDDRPEQRQYLANQHDMQHDPKFERENEYFFALGCQCYEIESKKREWELRASQNITEEDIKEKKLSALTAQLDALQKQMRAPYTAPEPPAPPEVTVGVSADVKFPEVGLTPKDCPVFYREARTEAIPLELQALPADAWIKYIDNIGGRRGEGMTSAGRYVQELASIIKRQAEGFFTIDEVAQVLADTSGGDATTRKAKLWRAIKAGKLDVLDTDDREPVLDLADVRDYMHWLKASDINAAGFIFPTQPPAPPVVADSAPGGVKPISNLPWWQVAYDIHDMAQNIGATRHSKGERTSNTEIAKEIEKRINDIERSKARDRHSPSWDTIRGVLTGWTWRPE